MSPNGAVRFRLIETVRGQDKAVCDFDDREGAEQCADLYNFLQNGYPHFVVSPLTR
jgi:hypothetical protein